MKRLRFFIFLLIFCIISMILLYMTSIVPSTIFYLIILFYVINLVLIFILLTRNKKKKKKKRKVARFFGILWGIILMIISGIAIFLCFKASSFFDKISNQEYETSNYSVIILKDSKYEKIDDLENIGIYKNELDKNYALAVEEFNDKHKVENKEYDGLVALVANLLESKVNAILINENYIEIIDETTSGFKDKTKVLDTVSIKSIKERKEVEKELSKLGNFNIYISGIDTYGDISNVSRSDVNIIATVDMKNSKILLTNTPRDYYIQLHGTTGDKDKLTHAGVYGIDMSMQTLEDLYETEINYYIRVNFNTLISLVDEIGGIDIYSDLAFVPHTNKSIYVEYGWNHFDGAAALAYSRERMAYLEGDIHRGKNQQQVIEAIIKKVTKSKDINTYLSLMGVLENSIQTNIDKKMIQGFINLQIKNNYNWNIESTTVVGYDSANYTYSYPGQYLYVMEPDYDSVNAAKDRIKEMLKKK